jgi:hypothetical protein
MSETNATCPNCGYCSHCGRSAQRYTAVPSYPWYPNYPWYTQPCTISWTTDTAPVMTFSAAGNTTTHFVGGFTVNQ